MAKKKPNRYEQIIESIFLKHFKDGAREIFFERTEIVKEAERLQIVLPKNLGDLIYTFRYRGELPQAIRDKAPAGEFWIIRPRAMRATALHYLTSQSFYLTHYLPRQRSLIQLPD